VPETSTVPKMFVPVISSKFRGLPGDYVVDFCLSRIVSCGHPWGASSMREYTTGGERTNRHDP
jgi:hypothetical protein